MADTKGFPEQIIVPIHGVRRGASGNWQQAFQLKVAEMAPGVLVVPFYYNRIPALKGFGLATLQKIGLGRIFEGDVRNFALFLQKIRAKYPKVPINILGHSNGTWITLRALMDFYIAVQNVVMVQPVFSRKVRNTPILKLFASNLVQRLFVWSSKNDKVIGGLVRMVTFNGMLPGYGMAGYSGIVREGQKEDMKNPLPQPFPEIALFNTVTNEPHGGVLDDLGKYLPVLLPQLTGKK